MFTTTFRKKKMMISLFFCWSFFIFNYFMYFLPVFELHLLWIIFQSYCFADLALSNKLIVYDLENQVIGWTEYNCKLHMIYYYISLIEEYPYSIILYYNIFSIQIFVHENLCDCELYITIDYCKVYTTAPLFSRIHTSLIIVLIAIS